VAEEGRALSDYLRHQRRRVRDRLESRAERGRLHLLAAAKRRSVAQQLALAILGQNPAAATPADDRPPGQSGGPTPPPPSAAAAAAGAAQEDRIMHVVQLLQREIALDTKAIGAFRSRLDRAGLGGPPPAPARPAGAPAPAPAPPGAKDSRRARAAGLEGRLAALQVRNRALVAAATDLARRQPRHRRGRTAAPPPPPPTPSPPARAR
jgi:hypothetical protein